MKIVVGLGNPGREYVGTRHNVGFDVVDALASRLGWIARPADFDRQARTKFESLTLDGVLDRTNGGPEKLLLLKPMVYMNLSGRCVRAALDFYQVSAGDVLTILDDLALPAGALRLRAGGSPGGHNGLKDIERALGTDQYPRLRLGIDPAGRVPSHDYVLQRFSDAQRTLIDPAVTRAAGAAVVWADRGITAAMQQFNSPDVSPKPSAPSTN